MIFSNTSLLKEIPLATLNIGNHGNKKAQLSELANTDRILVQLETKDYFLFLNDNGRIQFRKS